MIRLFHWLSIALIAAVFAADAPAFAETTGDECVILLHGLGRTSISMYKIEAALKGNGFAVVNWHYPSLRQGLTEDAERLNQVIQAEAKKHGKIHFVTHSLGGLVLRRWLKLHSVDNLGRIVMIAPPNHGSALSRRLLNGSLAEKLVGPAGQELKDSEQIAALCANPETDFMVIAGTRNHDIRSPLSWISGKTLDIPNDGTVAASETRLPNMTRYLEVPSSHTALVWHPTVIREVCAFLQATSAPPLAGPPAARPQSAVSQPPSATHSAGD